MVTISDAMTNAFQAYQTRNLLLAEQICRQVMAQKPTYIPALHLLGAIAQQTGRLDQAIACYRGILSLNPEHFEALTNLAIALQEQGELDLAQEYFHKALALNPDHARLHFNLGNLRVCQKDWKAAATHFRRAIALQPGYGAAHANLGQALHRQGQLIEAADHYRQVLVLQPEAADMHLTLGNLLEELNQVAAAVDHYERALALQPGWAAVHNNLALALRRLGQPERAIDHLGQAIALQPDYAVAHNNLGVLLQEQNRATEAIHHCQQAIALQPDYAAAHLNLGFACLTAGEFRRGFAEHEYRCQMRHFELPATCQPLWDGGDIAGKTMLVLVEQGFGDAIQFIRYVLPLAQLGCQVIVACQPELIRLFQTLPGVSQVVNRDHPLPAVDVYTLSMSLPHLLGDRLSDPLWPRVPYLTPPAVDSSLPRELTQLSPERLKVGLVWASGLPRQSLELRRFELHIRSHDNRSLPLAQLAQALPETTAPFSLQVGPQRSDLEATGLAHRILDLSPVLTDFAATAAAIAHLDLVISVDTCVVHLAGAMAKPAWLLLPFYADWRWLLERQDSPWYPTMRIFRQPQPGDWQSVLVQLSAALEAMP